MTTPYTYLIGWSGKNLYYYGVRHARGCDPSDLWVKYFTSSKRVKALRSELGEPDVIQIRRTFKSKANALEWESTVIRRMKMVLSESWANMNNPSIGFTHDGFARDLVCRERISEKRKEWCAANPEKAAENARRSGMLGAKKIGEKAKKRYEDPAFAQRNIDTHNTPEYLAALSQRTKSLFETAEYREKHLASINTPEYRRLMSERAKASSAKRIETRRRNMGEAGLTYGIGKS